MYLLNLTVLPLPPKNSNFLNAFLSLLLINLVYSGKKGIQSKEVCFNIINQTAEISLVYIKADTDDLTVSTDEISRQDRDEKGSIFNCGLARQPCL